MKTVLSGLPASPEITVSGLGLRLAPELILRRQGCQAEAQPSDHSLRAGAKTVWPVLELALRSQGCQAVAQVWIQ